MSKPVEPPVMSEVVNGIALEVPMELRPRRNRAHAWRAGFMSAFHAHVHPPRRYTAFRLQFDFEDGFRAARRAMEAQNVHAKSKEA